jgi:hypothetical protein
MDRHTEESGNQKTGLRIGIMQHSMKIVNEIKDRRNLLIVDLTKTTSATARARKVFVEASGSGDCGQNGGDQFVCPCDGNGLVRDTGVGRDDVIHSLPTSSFSSSSTVSPLDFAAP